MDKNLKPVPADKKKSLGKLPTDVRNKMGYAQKGKMMSNRDKRQKEITKKQNPKSEYKKDRFGKTKLSYAEARKGKMMKASKGGGADMSKTESRGTRIRKLLNAASAKGAAGEAAKEALKNVKLTGMAASEKEIKKLKEAMPKKAMGGEMKKGYGAARTSGMGLQDENLIPGKSMDYYKDLM